MNRPPLPSPPLQQKTLEGRGSASPIIPVNPIVISIADLYIMNNQSTDPLPSNLYIMNNQSTDPLPSNSFYWRGGLGRGGLKNLNGFTLIEILMSIFILSLMATTAMMGLRAVLETESHQEGVAKRLEDLQLAYIFLKQDAEQFIPGPTLDPSSTLPAFAAKNNPVFSRFLKNGLFTLTRGGYAYAQSPIPASSLRRIAYAFVDGKLYRYVWARLDTTASKPDERVLLDNISQITVRYLDDNGQFLSEWPIASAPGNNTLLPSTPSTSGLPNTAPSLVQKPLQPRAIEWEINAPALGKITWLFQLPGETYQMIDRGDHAI